MHKLILSTLSILPLLMYPLSLWAQNSFSLSLDVNGTAGDQAVTSVNVSADEIVAIQIFGTGIQNANGLAARFEYDASQVVYEGFEVGDALPNAQALPEHGTGFVEIGIASLGGQTTANSGLVGTVRFRTTAAFSGTAIRLVRAELSRGGQFETVNLDIRIALQFQAVTSDFDGDGVVNFADFLAFAGQFGARQGDGQYEAKYDLDSDGAIGFGDFLLFSSSFGKEVSTSNNGGGPETQVTIPDANLRAAIEIALRKASGASINRAEMASLISLEAPNSDIRDLTGLEFATGLTSLILPDNSISDLTPLSGLTNLTSLILSDNNISDLTPLSGLTNLTRLAFGGNSISDLSVLFGVISSLTNLRRLYLDNNSISDVSALSGLPDLEWLTLSNNNISDISALSGLTSLIGLYLRNNSISDLLPLVANTGLGTGDVVDIRNNPLSDTSINTHIPALQSRRVEVRFGALKPAVEKIEPDIFREMMELLKSDERRN